MSACTSQWTHSTSITKTVSSSKAHTSHRTKYTVTLGKEYNSVFQITTNIKVSHNMIQFCFRMFSVLYCLQQNPNPSAVSDTQKGQCPHMPLTLSDPTSDLVRQYDFPVPLRCWKTSITVFVAFVRPLSKPVRRFSSCSTDFKPTDSAGCTLSVSLCFSLLKL